MPSLDIIRPASKLDAREIEDLLKYKDHIHRHLDWRSPFDWLGKQPYFFHERDGIVQAALACPDDPQGVCWIRFFAAKPHANLSSSWQRLFNASLDYFSDKHVSITSVAIQKWYLQLLLQSNFIFLQTIVVLHMNTPIVFPPTPDSELTIKLMNDQDLKAITEVDRASFKPLWQNSFQGTVAAYQESAYATVATVQDKIVGYQMSSSTTLNAHLARLAVLPELQGRGIGTKLTKDMISYFSRRGIRYITVNTQSDNIASLRLYEKIGFEYSGERFPVMLYQAD